MRKIVYYLFVSLLLCACSQDDGVLGLKDNDQPIDNSILVGVNFSGEVSVDESMLSRAETESRDLIGIQVYKNGSRFCYGLFDSMQGVQVALIAGYTYKFVCTMIKNGKDICYHPDLCNYNGYPFFLGHTTYGNNCDNTFYYYTAFGSEQLASGNIALKNDRYSGQYCRAADRLYGEVSNYTPTVNGSITIPLRRVSCGIKVKVSGVTDGSANVKCYNDYNTFFENTNITNSAESVGEMYCMYNVKDAWTYAENDYQEAIKLSVKWTRGNGIQQDLGTKTVYVKRNVMNIIKVKLSTNDSDVDVDVDPEGGEMDNEDEDLSN